MFLATRAGFGHWKTRSAQGPLTKQFSKKEKWKDLSFGGFWAVAVKLFLRSAWNAEEDFFGCHEPMIEA
jgi:hypothetical protein